MVNVLQDSADELYNSYDGSTKSQGSRVVPVKNTSRTSQYFRSFFFLSHKNILVGLAYLNVLPNAERTGNVGTSWKKETFLLNSVKTNIFKLFFVSTGFSAYPSDKHLNTYVWFVESEVPRCKSSSQYTLAKSNNKIHHPKPTKEMIYSHTV